MTRIVSIIDFTEYIFIEQTLPKIVQQVIQMKLPCPIKQKKIQEFDSQAVKYIFCVIYLILFFGINIKTLASFLKQREKMII